MAKSFARISSGAVVVNSALETPSGNPATDRSTLQSAFSNAYNNGYTAVVGPGTWQTNGPIELEWVSSDDVCPIAIGYGSHQSIIQTTGGHYAVHYDQAGATLYRYGNGGGLENIGFKGSGVAGEGAIRARGVWNFSLKRCRFSNFTGASKVVWFDLDDEGGGTTDGSTSTIVLIEQCMFDVNTGAVCIFSGDVDGNLYNTPWMQIKICRFNRQAQAVKGGFGGLLFENCNVGYSTEKSLEINQESARSTGVTIRNSGFEGGKVGEIALTAFCAAVENNRFTGVYISESQPTADLSVITLGDSANSRDASRVRVSENSFSYGEITDTFGGGGSRVYVTAVDQVVASNVRVENNQFPNVDSDTFDNWGHTRVAFAADGSSNNSVDDGNIIAVSKGREADIYNITDPGSVTPNLNKNSFVFVQIGTEGSPPSTPAYTINAPTFTVPATAGLRSGVEITFCIYNSSGQTLSDSNFSFNSEWSKAALPSIATNRWVWAKFQYGAAAASIHEKWFQMTDWLVVA